jgi:hypothetical protein
MLQREIKLFQVAHPRGMSLIKMLAIDVFESFMILVENKLFVGQIIAPILNILHNSIKLQVIS